MSKKRIRNPEAYTAARKREEIEKQNRIQRVAEDIHDVFFGGMILYGEDLKKIAWTLRLHGVLGARDRNKDESDQYNALVRAGLWLAIENGYVVKSHQSGQIKVKSSGINTLTFRDIRRLENKTDRVLIDIDSIDTVDTICETVSRRYIHTKGSSSHTRELALH